MDSIGTIVTGSEDTRIPGRARTRLDQDQGTQDRGRCWIRSIRIEEPHDQLVLSHHTGSVHVHRPCLARASKGVSHVQCAEVSWPNVPAVVKSEVET